MTFATRLTVLFSFFAILILNGCNKIPENPWEDAIPNNAAVVIIPEERTSLNAFFSTEYATFIQSIATSPIEIVTTIENATGTSVLLHAMAIHPTGANSWAPLFVGKTVNRSVKELSSSFERPFTENTYEFNGVTIYRFFIPDSDIILFVSQIYDHVLISENSLALEASIRSYLGIDPSMSFENGISGESYIIHFPSLGNFFRMYGAIRFRPLFKDLFSGLESMELEVSSSEGVNDRKNFTFTGNTRVSDEPSTLVESISTPASNFTIDRLVPSDAAFMGLFRQSSAFEIDETIAISAIDSSLAGQPGLITAIKQTLDTETAVIGFNTIGFSSLEETAYIRKVRSESGIEAELDRLVQRGQIEKINDTYAIRSRYLGVLLGSELCPYQDFYLSVMNGYIILAPRIGLIQRIMNDNARRRVLYYEEDYTRIRNQQSTQLSAFFYVNSLEFMQFMQPFTDPVSNPVSFMNFYDVLALGVSYQPESDLIEFEMKTYALEQTDRPFADRWFYPLDGSQLTGPAVISNLYAPDRVDVVFSTTANRVIALASDGTELFRTATGSDTPIGSPVVYDWYANNQKTILIGAGNKIYAWNNRGESLPGFPFVLDEEITSPIVVADVSRTGLPEIIVTTADRQVHILNNRGANITGWPQRVNSLVRSSPLFAVYNGQHTITTFSENGVFMWENSGELIDGFPAFTETTLSGKPVIHQNTIYAGGYDGQLYAFSNERVLSENAKQTHQTADENTPLTIASVNVSETPAVVSGVNEVRIRNEFGQIETTPSVLVQSRNGSVFLYSTDGKLLFVQSMGQPSPESGSAQFADINGNNQLEVVSKAAFGRIFAWNVLSDNTITTLPTTAVDYPVFARLTGEANVNLIAGTREGLRAWVILR